MARESAAFGRPILLIEDSPGDAELVRLAFKKSSVDGRLVVAPDGGTGLAILRGEFEDGKIESPELVILDLNLPDIDGREVLRIIRETDGISHLPVVVLTTSDETDDIEFSYKHHANCFITKPVGFTEFVEAVREIERFWLNTASVPGRGVRDG